MGDVTEDKKIEGLYAFKDADAPVEDYLGIKKEANNLSRQNKTHSTSSFDDGPTTIDDSILIKTLNMFSTTTGDVDDNEGVTKQRTSKDPNNFVVVYQSSERDVDATCDCYKKETSVTFDDTLKTVNNLNLRSSALSSSIVRSSILSPRESIISLSNELNNKRRSSDTATSSPLQYLFLSLFILYLLGVTGFSAWLGLAKIGLSKEIPTETKIEQDTLGDEEAVKEKYLLELKSINNQHWIKISDFNKRILDLNAENNNLQSIMKTFKIQETTLINTKANYEELNVVLRKSIAFQEKSTLELKTTSTNYRVANDQLNELNIDYRLMNGELSNKETEFKIELVTLNKASEQLGNVLKRIQQENKELVKIQEGFEKTSHQLNTAIEEQKNILLSYEEENAHQLKIANNCNNLISFFNETQHKLDETFDAWETYLEESILTRELLTLEGLQSKSQTIVLSWECAVLDHIDDSTSTSKFMKNKGSSIGVANYEALIGYLTESLFSPLCLSRNDFNLYVTQNKYHSLLSHGGEMTYNQLKSSVNMYATNVQSHYFPDSNDVSGLSHDDWYDANFDCASLPEEKKYYFHREQH
mmetsp:Transcript_48513/g.48875  ORF Transcript_48513/g.48875 Transcript_48513/m.48875 type:complete len:587 (-) Transcript_48513:24-1784(-)